MAKKKVEEFTIEEKLQNALIPEKDQPYKIPQNWCWVRLTVGFAKSLDNMRKPINAKERENRVGDVPYYGATGQIGWIDDYLTNEHLVLLGEDGAPFLDWNKNKSYIIEGKAWVNNHAHILKSFYGKNGNIYLNYYLNIFDYFGYVNGSTRLKLTHKNMDRIPVPLPPLAEQERIANKLDNYISKLDEAKEKLEKVVDTYNYRKNLILHRAFTGQLTKNWRKENPNIELNEDIKNKAITKDSMLPDEYLYKIPENWRWVRLSDIGEIVTGNTPNTKDKSYFGGNVPFIKPAELDQEENIISSAETLTEKGKNISRSVRKGSTCICCIGTIGKCGFLRVESVTNQQINTVIPYDFLDDLFVYYYCSSKFFKTVIRERSCATTIYIINKTKTSKLPFPLPPLEEQKEIVKILDSILSKEKQVKEIAEKEIERVEDLKKNLLTRAFGGILGTNDPNEENSIELLKSVL